MFTGLFGLVDVNTGVFMVLFVIVFILLDVIYSLRDISYWGMIPAISSDSHERSTYTALGAFTGSIGYNGVTVIVVPVVSWFTWKFTGQWEQGRTGWAAFASSSPCSACSPRGASRSAPERTKAGCAPRPSQRQPHRGVQGHRPERPAPVGGLSYLLYSVANVVHHRRAFLSVQVRARSSGQLLHRRRHPGHHRTGHHAPLRCSTAASRAAGCTSPAWRS